MRKLHRAFTLVELLIVIVVIGILSAAMMMASSEAISTAKATQIINDLRMLSTAAQHWYFDNEANLILTKSNGYKFKLNGKEIQFHDALNSDSFGVKQYISNSNFSLNESKKGTDPTKGTDEDYKTMYAAVGGYSIYLGFKNTVCYAAYRLSGDDKKRDNARLRAKLKSRAQASRLVYYDYGKQTETAYNGENFVCMRVFALDESKIKSK